MVSLLVVVYAYYAVVGGNLVQLNLGAALPFLQVNAMVWTGALWMLFTSMFLHADLAHLLGNVFFLIIFGLALEEHVSRGLWLLTYLVSGVIGNLCFLFLGGDSIGLGASGAVWGLLGMAGGRAGVLGMILFGGFNIFAGGGFLAHAGGLASGLVLRQVLPRRTSPTA